MHDVDVSMGKSIERQQREPWTEPFQCFHFGQHCHGRRTAVRFGLMRSNKQVTPTDAAKMRDNSSLTRRSDP